MRFFILSILFSAVALLGCGEAVAESESEKPARASKRPSRASFINIKALHESLPGSHMHDPACLLFRVKDCNVIALADEKGHLKLFVVGVAPEVKKAKRRDALAEVKRQLRLLYCLPQQPRELMSSTGAAALLYFDDVGEGEELDAEEVLAMPRCDALMHMISLTEMSKLREVSGLACFFRLTFEKVEMDFGIDLNYSSVNYIELRGCRIFGSKMKVNVEEEVKNMFPSLDGEFSRKEAVFGKGSKRLRTLGSDGTFYLGRNARFFAAGTQENLENALKLGACYKTYGFAAPSFAEWTVTLPDKVDASTLLTDPSAPVDEEEEEEEEEEENEGDAEEVKEHETTNPAPPATPAQPAAPLTPEEARKAYLKQLREM